MLGCSRRLTLPKAVWYRYGMTPSTSPPDPDAPRPLPRRLAPRPAAPPRSNRPRFQALDAAWILLLCAASLGASAWLGEVTGRHLPGSLAAAGIAAALYALGWRARDRAAGIGAGLLAALSPQFLFWAAYSPQSASFTLLALTSLLAFAAGSVPAALALAAGAAMVRPDGLLLGLLLLGVSAAQRRPRTGLSAAFFLGLLLASVGAGVALGHGLPRLPVFALHSGGWRWLWQPPSLLLIWLLLPFIGEWSEPQRRARWLPVVLWLGVSLISASVQSVTTSAGMILPALPVLFLLAGGGLSRLLPMLAGEYPKPALRYGLAAAAILLLAFLHGRLERTLIPAATDKSAATGLRSR